MTMRYIRFFDEIGNEDLHRLDRRPGVAARLVVHLPRPGELERDLGRPGA